MNKADACSAPLASPWLDDLSSEMTISCQQDYASLVKTVLFVSSESLIV